MSHIYLKRAICDYSRKDHRIHKVYYANIDGIAYFALDFSGKRNQGMINNLCLLLDRASTSPYKLYSVLSQKGESLQTNGSMIYDESVDKRRGKRKRIVNHANDMSEINDLYDEDKEEEEEEDDDDEDYEYEDE